MAEDANKIQLIVGLANPGADYAKTRHNAGAWLLEEIASRYQVSLRPESKFQGMMAVFHQGDASGRLLIPSNYMNQNGISVGTVARFYNIPPQAILIAHDELDFPAGVVKLKQGGGHGGHNGLRNVIQHLQSSDFFRIRIGIGHPGDRNKVHDYVLNRPSQSDHAKIMDAIAQINDRMDDIVNGDIQRVMQALHTR